MVYEEIKKFLPTVQQNSVKFQHKNPVENKSIKRNFVEFAPKVSRISKGRGERKKLLHILKSLEKEKFCGSLVGDTSEFSFKPVCPLEIVKYLSKKFYFAEKNREIYFYDTGAGFYKFLANEKNLAELDVFVRNNTPKNWEGNRFYSMLTEVFRNIVALCQRDSKAPNLKKIADNPRSYVVFKNGTLNLKSGILEGHSSDLSASFGYDFAYRPNMGIEGTNFEKYILRFACYDEEVVKLFRIALGLCFSNIRDLKVAFYIFGEANNGKSVLEKFLYQVIGYDFAKTSSVSHIGSRFGLGDLDKAQVLLFSDIELAEWSPRAISVIKGLVSLDPILTEQKNIAAKTEQHRCILFFFANSLPIISPEQNAGGAMSTRLFALPTGSTVSEEERDPSLLEKMFQEREIVVSWALDAIKGIANGEPLPEKIIDLNMYWQENAPVQLVPNTVKWAENCIELGEASDFLYTSDLYSSYCYWLELQGIHTPLASRAFSMELAKYLREKLPLVQKLKGAKNRNGYRGLKLKEDI